MREQCLTADGPGKTLPGMLEGWMLAQRTHAQMNGEMSE